MIGGVDKDPDVILSVLVRIADQTRESSVLSITLFTAAGTFAGDLIGERRWLDLFREILSPNSEGGAVFAAGLKEYDEQLDERQFDAATSGEVLPRKYIHLDNAWQLRDGRWHHAGPMRLWRGQLADITAWTLGAPAEQRSD